MFGVGKVAEARPLRAPEILRHLAAAIPAEKSRYRSVGVDDDERPASPREPAPDRSGEADEIADIAAENQLRARDAAFDHA